MHTESSDVTTRSGRRQDDDEELLVVWDELLRAYRSAEPLLFSSWGVADLEPVALDSERLLLFARDLSAHRRSVVGGSLTQLAAELFERPLRVAITDEIPLGMNGVKRGGSAPCTCEHG
jgi:hypothetical protein